MTPWPESSRLIITCVTECLSNIFSGNPEQARAKNEKKAIFQVRGCQAHLQE